jgi:hypothetical protein
MKQIETAQAFSATFSQVKPCDSLPTWPLGPALQVWSNEAVAKSCGLKKSAAFGVHPFLET